MLNKKALDISQNHIYTCQNNDEALKSVLLFSVISKISNKVTDLLDKLNIWNIKTIEEIFYIFTEWWLITQEEQKKLLDFLKSKEFLDEKEKLIEELSFTIDNNSIEFFTKQIDKKTQKLNWNDFYNWTINKLENYEMVEWKKTSNPIIEEKIVKKKVRLGKYRGM